MKTLIHVFLFLLFTNNATAQNSKYLQKFSEADVMGCSCWIYSSKTDISTESYYVAVDFAGEWKERVAFIKYGDKLRKLNITNTSVKDMRFGIDSYFEVYKNNDIEIRIDYNKILKTGEETDLYDITLTVKYRGQSEKLTTKAVCGC